MVPATCGLAVPTDVLGRRGSFCIQALQPGEEAPDDPPPLVVPGQTGEVVLPVPMVPPRDTASRVDKVCSLVFRSERPRINANAIAKATLL